MNLKSSILKIAVVIALICMLVPVIAAEDVDDTAVTESVDASTDVVSEDISAADELTADEDATTVEEDADDEDPDDEAADDEGTEEGDEEDEGEVVDDAEDGAEDESADLQISVIAPKNKVAVGDLAKFGILVYNNGPDAASNVVVRCALISGHMYVIKAVPSQGEFDTYNGIWYVGDLEPGEYAFLAIEGVVLSDEDLLLVATVTSDTPDPDESNNLAFGYIDVVAGEEPAAETLPATGNPIALALLALLSVAGVSLRRKF